jgi:hypothetical protein
MEPEAVDQATAVVDTVRKRPVGILMVEFCMKCNANQIIFQTFALMMNIRWRSSSRIWWTIVWWTIW